MPRYNNNCGARPATNNQMKNNKYQKPDEYNCRPTQVFLSTKAPHQAVGRPSISRWLVSLIGRAGIDITTYSGHSTRSAVPPRQHR